MPRIAIAKFVGDAVPSTGYGAVHSVFRRACNIQIADGRLLTLLASDQTNLPGGIRLAASGDSMLERLVPGQSAFIAQRVLYLPELPLRVDFSDAEVFRSTLAPRAALAHSHEAAALSVLRATLRAHLPAQGFAPVLLGDSTSGGVLQQALAATLAQALPELMRAVARRNCAGLIDAARQIIGLGPGLTPSGDDFLAGFMATLWRNRSEAGMRALLAALPPRLESALVGTHAVGRQMLRDAARGRFPQVLVDVAQALGGTDADNVAACTLRALALGSSSGADMLCGLQYGVEALHKSRATPAVPPRAARLELSPIRVVETDSETH